MKKNQKKNRKGATSFYIVAFSTLILVIIAVSFAAQIISAITRTSNDELSQSAYDSALAGVEDAKLAYANYIKCKESGKTPKEPSNGSTDVTCEHIMWWMEHPDCDMVGHILGREIEDGGVTVRETKDGNNEMEQSYTCVTINTKIGDYRSHLSSTTPTKVVRVKFDDDNVTSNLEKVKISWYTNKDNSNKIRAYSDFSSSKVTFYPVGQKPASVPPTLMVGLIQTAGEFHLSDFNKSDGDRTDRATVYLVPNDNNDIVSKQSDNFISAYDKGDEYNNISVAGLVKSNDHTVMNKPFVVYCNDDVSSEFSCSVDIDLPKPVNGERNNETFAMVVSIPYGQTSTDFALKFFCKDSGCKISDADADTDADTDTEGNVAVMSNTQVEVDSTGRANNLYRRVLTRLEGSSNNAATPFYALQTGGGSSSKPAIEKNLIVSSEYGL